MNWVERAQKICDDIISRRPDLKEDVDGLFSLMLSEISDGSSPENELELFEESVKDLEHENM